MKFLVRLTAFCFGLMLLICLGFLYSPRQKVSGAYWLLENDTTPYPAVLYRMLPDGRMKTPILVEEVPYQSALWYSEDGYLFYATIVEYHFVVRRLPNIYGHQPQTIVGPYPSDITYPHPDPFSPDGQYMVFAFHDGELPNRIVRTDADGMNEEVIYEGDMRGFDGLVWSPDSQWIYFSAYDGRRGIYRLHVDGSRLELLTSFGEFSNAAWVRNGERIRFTYGSGIFEIDAAGGKPTWLLYMPDFVTIRRNLMTSTDVMYIVAGGFDKYAVYRIDFSAEDTPQVVQVTPFSKRDSSITLLEERGLIIFASTIEDVFGIYQMNLDGSDLKLVYALEDDTRLLHVEPIPDEESIIASYWGMDFNRIRIHLDNGQVETMPTRASLFTTPLVDFPLHNTGLLAIAFGLFWLPMVFHRFPHTP